jgi:hypothetical protein
MYLAQKWAINSMLTKTTPSLYNLLACHHLPTIACPLARTFFNTTQE